MEPFIKAGLVLITLILGSVPVHAEPVAIPQVNMDGPPYEGMVREVHGEGSQRYWIFRPAAPGRYPVVVLIHGWAATEPIFYMAWIRHLVGDGIIVVYPRYQNLLDTSSENFTENSAYAVRKALGDLEGEFNGRLYIAGHSAGGIIAVNLAARGDIPKPVAVLSIQPGDSEGGRKLQNLSKIPGDVILVVMAGDADTITGTADSHRIMRMTPQIPPGRKIFLLVQSDRTLVADHLSPLAVSDEYGLLVDNLDYSGYWKVLDILIDLEGDSLTSADMDELTGMGTWDDGRPVKRMRIIT